MKGDLARDGGICRNSVTECRLLLRLCVRGQTWTLEPSGHLKNGNGYYLAMPGDTKDQGKAPVVWDKSGERGQLWTFE